MKRTGPNALCPRCGGALMVKQRTDSKKDRISNGKVYCSKPQCHHHNISVVLGAALATGPA